MTSEMPLLEFKNREAWRKWLEHNHHKSRGIWLVFYKKHTKIPSIYYDEAVEEAICFGWIDSILKRIDEQKYCQKFTPRNPGSSWSALNVKRADKMIEHGKMTESGLASYKDVLNGNTKPLSKPDSMPGEIPPDLLEALEKNKTARKNFNDFPASSKRLYTGWIISAKKPETRARRINEAVGMIAENIRYPMK